MSKKPSEVIRSEIETMCAAGVALSRISDLAGVDRTTLWKWVNRKAPRGIGADNFDRLCEFFGYSLCRKPLRNR